MIEKIQFFKLEQASEIEDMERIVRQLNKTGFKGNIKIYHLGYDFEDSISLIIEGNYDGENCCWAVGYGMNRSRLAFRKKWYRHAPPREF